MSLINGWIRNYCIEFGISSSILKPIPLYCWLCFSVVPMFLKTWLFNVNKYSFYFRSYHHRISKSDSSSRHSNTTPKPRINTTPIACFRMFSTTAKRFVSPETFTSTSANTTWPATTSVLQAKTILARSRSHINFRVNIFVCVFFSIQFYFQQFDHRRHVHLNKFLFHKCGEFRLSQKKQALAYEWDYSIYITLPYLLPNRVSDGFSCLVRFGFKCGVFQT